MSESVFDLPQTLESINGGCSRYDMSQMYPISGNVSGVVGGSTGNAKGLTTFQWQDSTWWSPSQSYFYMKCTFTRANSVPSDTDPTAYADNFAMTLFSQINTQINSRPLDTVNLPHLIDTALTYSNAHNNFLKTFGSLARVGEPLSTRIRNTTQNNGIVDVVFRPPVSIFDVKLLPPGAQFTLNFNWAANGLNAFETIDRSVAWGTGSNEVSISISELSFYKATVTPGYGVELPDRGVIDLHPCMIMQYFINSSNTLKQNITLPATTNRILVGFQDITPNIVTTDPPVDNICGVGSGYNPATSFTNKFCNSSSNNLTFSSGQSMLSTLWIDLPELGIQEPKPIYNFSSGITEYMRAYSDFCHVTQGTKDNTEGSVPFGSMATDLGVTIIQPVRINDTGPVINAGLVQIGDINNPQQYTYIPTPNAAASLPAIAVNTNYNQTARWGWLGRIPGPIFAFPVVRPQGKTISTGTINATTAAFGSGTSTAYNAVANVIASYSMAIVVVRQPNDYYSYDIVETI